MTPTPFRGKRPDMLRRLGFGLAKGLLLGVGLGLLFQLALRWTVTPELLGFLISMGTGATVATLAGKPPWHDEAWLESLLKAVSGLAIGALIFWALSTYVGFRVPLELLGSPEGTPWTEIPMLYVLPTAALVGILIELDNSPAKRAAGKNRATKAVVASPETDEDDIIDWDA